MKNNIGVFDSGFGGLSILRGITKKLPQYNYIYLGDNARAPYGSRSSKIVLSFTKQAVEFLFKKNCGLVILACNTASSEALGVIQRNYLPKNKKVLGVLVPAAEVAVASTLNKRVGVIATEGTVSSNAFVEEIYKLDSGIKVFQKSCPLLVPLIEYGEHNTIASSLIIEKYLKSLLEHNIDTLILGCTHYGLIEKQIKKIVGSNIKIVSEAKVVPPKLEGYLSRHLEIANVLTKEGNVEFFSTDLTERFEKLGSKFYGKSINVQKATLI